MRIDASTRTVQLQILLGKQEHIPSFSMAIISTMKGEKSYFQIKAMSINPSCKTKLTLGCSKRKPFI